MRYCSCIVQNASCSIYLALSALIFVACGGSTAGSTEPTEHTSSPITDVEPNSSGSELDDSLYSCHEPTGSIRASFMPGVELGDLVVWAAGFTCKNIVYDPALVCASVTIVSPREMTAEEAWSLFVASVETAGLTVAEAGETVSITGSARCDAPRVGDHSTDSADDPEQVSAALVAGVTKVDDTHYDVERAVLDALLDDVSLSGGARIVPSVKDGQPNGYKLYAIRPSSVYAALGIKNGDTIHSINGHALLDVADVLATYEQLRASDNFDVSITRRGKPITIQYTIR